MLRLTHLDSMSAASQAFNSKLTLLVTVDSRNNAAIMQHLHWQTSGWLTLLIHNTSHKNTFVSQKVVR